MWINYVNLIQVIGIGNLKLLVIDVERLGEKLVAALILPRKICLKVLINREKITLRTL